MKKHLHSFFRGEGSKPYLVVLAVGMAVVVAAILLYYSPLLAPTRAVEVPYSQFLNALEKGTVESVRISQTKIRWTMVVGGVEKFFASERLPGIDETHLINELMAKGVEFGGKGTNNWAGNILLFLVIGGGFYVLWRRMPGQQMMTFGKNGAQPYEGGKRRVTYDDVAGAPEAVMELREIADYLEAPERYQRLGGRAPKGVLLVGPPGTGKTLLARATAGEASVPFFSISGSEFVEMYVGGGAARIRRLFQKAREHAPCIVFIDELDTIGRQRSGSKAPNTHEEREQTLNQLLVEMDGFDNNTGIILMAATNRPDVLDPALLRPGRFDRQVVVDRPSRAGRKEILELHARRIRVADDVDFEVLAARTPGFAGAELENLINEAALLAARRGSEVVTMEDLNEAVDRVMMGLVRQGRVLGEKERHIVAYHEMGHALAANLLPNADPVHKVSIVPRGVAALGVTMQLPQEDRYLMREAELHDRLAVLLGGRAAEEVVFGEISTGAANDLQKATELARRMVTEFGMSPLVGPVSLSARSDNAVMPGMEQHMGSGKLEEIVDAEVKRIIEENYKRVRDLLVENRDVLETLSRELLEVEDMDGETFQRRLAELGARPAAFTPHSLAVH